MKQIKSLFMTKNIKEGFENSSKYWICKKEYEELKVKVEDDDHITGKYLGYAHQGCNLNLVLSKKIPAMFHNLQNFDS